MLCAGCGKPVGAGSGRGRPVRYHDAAHRQRARRARLATDHQVMLGTLTDLEAAVSEARHAVLAGQDPTKGYRYILAATAALADRLAPATRESGVETEPAVTESVTAPEAAPRTLPHFHRLLPDLRCPVRPIRRQLGMPRLSRRARVR